MSQAMALKISDEILLWKQEHEGTGIAAKTLTKAEKSFLAKAANKGAEIVRGGWPDFVIELDGQLTFVEVKHGTDIMSPKQRKMFATLEKVGIHVMIWDSSSPDVLTPWRKSKRMPWLNRDKRR